MTRSEMEHYLTDCIGLDQLEGYTTQEMENLLKTTKGEYAATLWLEALDYNNK